MNQLVHSVVEQIPATISQGIVAATFNYVNERTLNPREMATDAALMSFMRMISGIVDQYLPLVIKAQLSIGTRMALIPAFIYSLVQRYMIHTNSFSNAGMQGLFIQMGYYTGVTLVGNQLSTAAIGRLPFLTPGSASREMIIQDEEADY